MALMPVAEALARVLADADAAAGRSRRRSPTRMAACWPPISRRCARSRRPTSRPWTAMPCARPMSRRCRRSSSSIGEVAAGHPFEGTVGAGEAARIFTGGVLPPGADTIVIQENAATRRRHRRRRNERSRQGQAHPRRRARFQAGSGAAGQGPPPQRPRSRARRRHEPPDACRCIAAPRWRCWRPATNW